MGFSKINYKLITILFALLAVSSFVFPKSTVYANTASSNNAALTITSPNGGESLVAGQPYRITWDSTNIDKVIIDYIGDFGSFSNSIASNIPDVNYYDWTPYNGTGHDLPWKIVMVGISGGFPVVRDESDNFFTVLAPTPTVEPEPTEIPKPTSTPEDGNNGYNNGFNNDYNNGFNNNYNNGFNNGYNNLYNNGYNNGYIL